MPSNKFAAEHRSQMDWRAEGLRYFGYSHYLKQVFGHRVQRVSLDAGFTCPNVDGTVALGGCAFCDNRSFSPSRRLPGETHEDIMATAKVVAESDLDAVKIHNLYAVENTPMAAQVRK